jgi:hypothetical protein
MRALEIIATIVTGVLALIGLWTVSMAVQIETKRRKRTRELKKEQP